MTTTTEDITSTTTQDVNQEKIPTADPQTQTKGDDNWFVVRSADGTRSGKKYPNCRVCEVAFKPLENEYVIAEDEILCAICEDCTHIKCAAECKRCAQTVCKFCGTAGVADSSGELCLYCVHCIEIEKVPLLLCGGSKRACGIETQQTKQEERDEEEEEELDHATKKARLEKLAVEVQ